MKKFKVELSSLGITSKTVNYNDYQWTLTHGQIIKESALTKNFPQFFVEYNETHKEEIVETKEEVTVHETKEEEVESENNVEVETENNVDVETETTDTTVEEKIDMAKTFKTKVDLAAYAKDLGIELSINNSLKNMVKEFETTIKG